MPTIVSITSEFYAPTQTLGRFSETLGRYSTNPNVIGSKWTVVLLDGSTKTKVKRRAGGTKGSQRLHKKFAKFRAK